MTATVPVFAHPYAHPVEKRSQHRYGPHASDVPEHIELKCAGRYPVCGGENHPRAGSHMVLVATHPRLRRQRQQLNDLAHRQAMDRPLEDSVTAPTKQQPGTFLSGWCNPSNPDSSHARCSGSHAHGDTMLLCRCNRDDCRCNKARLEREAQASGAILCGPTPTEGDLQQVAAFAEELRQRAQPSRTAWRAEEVAELMVELEACPVCEQAWDGHTFTDDDQVVCA